MERNLRVKDRMAGEVATLRANDKLTIADDVMRLGRIRHLPVLDDDDQEIVGLLSQRDLFRGALARSLGYGGFAQQKLLGTLSVKDVMSSPVATIDEEAPLKEAARQMLERKIGCLVVTRKGRLAGILTESDFVRFVAEES
jgi:CBS domain-containing membrane protein